MRSTFLGFETAKRGIQANQKGLDITGQNITNINTPGYTRQRVDFISVSGSTNDRIRRIGVGNAGQGVAFSGVSQIRNEFLDARFRNEFAQTGYYDKAVSMLDGIEAVLNEVNTGLKPALSDVINSLHDFSGKPDQITNANIVRSTTKSMADLVNHIQSQLSQLQQQYTSDLHVDITNLNNQLKEVSLLNESIAQQMLTSDTPTDTTNVNELLDQRNMILDQLSQYGNIRVTMELDGTATVSMNDHPVVFGNQSEQINLLKQPNGTVNLTWQTNGQPVILSSGTIKASNDFINGTAGITKGVPYYQAQLNQFAFALSDLMNSTFTNEDGSFKQLIEFQGNTMKLTSDFEQNPGYILSTTNSLDNKEILSLIHRLEHPVSLSQFNGTLADFVDSYVTTLGQDISFYSSRYDVSMAIVNDIEHRRDSISGVSLDEEGAQLMMYDKAYKATARLMTTMDEALDIIINRTGLVGR